MNARRNHLASKLAETKDEHFEWIWDEAPLAVQADETVTDLYQGTPSSKWLDKWRPGFVPWLKNNSPIFWIFGKPASGKSTLMKFISANERCSQILNSASGREWHLINFFFDYRLHKNEANSMEGMFKSLLSQLIDQSPAISHHIASSDFGKSLRLPFHEAPLNELRNAILSAITSTECHVCMFVDGLDEFEASYRPLVVYLKSLADGERVKICLASQPELQLQHALKDVPSIAMQDYNESTIAAYVRDSLTEYAESLPEASLQRLTDEIVRNSSGVILWSQLVCADVVEGMLAYETKTELLNRISSFPSGLNEVYDRLFERMDSRYFAETALILYLVNASMYARSTSQSCRECWNDSPNSLVYYHILYNTFLGKVLSAVSTPV